MTRHLKIKIAVLTFLLVLCWPYRHAEAAENKDLPLSVQRVLYQAQTLVAAKKPAEARRKLETYRRKKQRSHYMIEFTLGDIRMLSRDYPGAAAAYRKALALKADFAPAWMNLGKAAYEMADYPTAADSFQRAYRTDAAKQPARLYYCATAWLMAEKPSPGLAAFKTLLKKHPAAVELAWKPVLVQLYLALAQPLAALPVIEELAAKTTGPRQVQWQETLLGQYLALGKTGRALAFARRLTRTAPTVARWWQALAHLHLEQQAFEPALEALMIHAGLTEPDAAATKLLADLSLQAGIPVLAVRYYREIAGFETDPEIAARLTRALRRLDRRAEAVQVLDRCLQKQADGPLLCLKAELLFEMKRYPEAAATYRQCALIQKPAGRAWLMAGYAAWQAGDPAGAKAALNRARTFPGQARSARAALAELANTDTGRKP